MTTDTIPHIEFPECYDDEHDQCPEIIRSILRPDGFLICNCSCHD